MATLRQEYNQSKINSHKFALWVAIATIIMMFAAFTSAYIVRRAAGNWLEFKLPDIFMVNTAVDYYRKSQKWTGQLSLDEVDVPDWNDDVISAISAQEILALVQKLPPAYRMVFTMYVVDGYSHREIGDLLNIQEGTSKSNLRDARRKLQLMIKLYHPHLYQTYNWPNSGRHEN